MPKNEDGEFELILGNKQLLGMFFVVIVLLGVFFVMGYLVGRNSAPLVNTEVSSTHKTDTKPTVADSPVPKEAPTPVIESPAPTPAPPKPIETAVQKAPEPKPEPPKPEPTKPSTSKSEPATSKAEAIAKREAAKEKEKEKARPAPSSAPAQNGAVVAGANYLQLSATSKHDADGVVEVLRKNNFPALDAEVPEKQGTFRVLVGPVPAGDINKMRSELQAKGFPGNGAILKKF